jgi:hypothetical protein
MNYTPSRTRVYSLAALRLIAAIALLATGAIHLEQYIVAGYRLIPTIGPLFLLNFIAGTVLGLYFLIPASASVSRIRRSIDMVAAVTGFALAAGALIALLISEHTPLFGFMEYGYRREIVIAIVAEALAIVGLAAFLAVSYRGSGLVRTTKGSDGTVNLTAPTAAAEPQRGIGRSTRARFDCELAKHRRTGVDRSSLPVTGGRAPTHAGGQQDRGRESHVF